MRDTPTMDNQLLTGRLTRLVAADPDKLGELNAKWSRDSEFFILFDSDPVMTRNAKRAAEFFRERAEKERPGVFSFLVQRLDDERIIGEGGLWGAFSKDRDAWVSIGIGERELWGKGYGSDALNVLLRFAFREVNLHRVNLATFEYNPRAVRAYEKLGFAHEGALRRALRRGGKRWAILVMGILRDEWLARQNNAV
jgi:RimJ/RimL family protein N-acetyltransferase